MDDRNDITMPHRMTMENRESLHVTGVTDVKCFDEETVELVTTAGELTVLGTDLHIAVLQLETGDLHLTGKVTSMQYRERLTKRGKIGRMFR